MEALSSDAIQLLILTLYRIGNIFVVFIRMLLPLWTKADNPSEVFLQDVLRSAPLVSSILFGALIVHDLLVPLHSIKPLIEFLPSHLYLLEGLAFLGRTAHLQLRYYRTVIIV